MKKKRLVTFGALAAFMLALIVGTYLNQAHKKHSDKIQVLTTFYPMYAFTKAVVGDQGDVSLLIKAGTEPHDFEPSTKDVATIQKVDVLVYDSDAMETWVPKVKKSIGSNHANFIEATSQMTLLEAGDDDHDEKNHDHHHDKDPHVWLSPKRAITVVETIRDHLSKQYPDKAGVFKKNAAQYIQKLQALDKDYQQAFSSAKQTHFITQHDSFAYLAHDYGLEQIHINGFSADSEPSAQHLATLSQKVRDYHLSYVYFEENASTSVAQTLAKEAGVKPLVLNTLESLSKEDMDKGEDYLTIMRANLTNLRKTTDNN